MKRIISFFVYLLLPLGLFSQQLEVAFEIKNAGFPVEVCFTKSEVDFEFDMQNLSSSFFKASVDVLSLNTGIKSRDRHLLKEKYFYVDEYPEMTFQSSKVYEEDGDFMVKGQLTIKGTTKEVVVPIEILKDNKGVSYFMAEFTLNRRDYEVGQKHLFLSDEVMVTLKLNL